ncbi:MULTISPECIES: hypothetical protein [unclassified Tolypothrix]|nr:MULTISPECIES: hypothetical protein [unclassified Tolypothrix]BAY92469.1 hypothetical protein NIES3275_45050 [Microchaete diplosiphon NIES-3275]EKF06016.1 hypothetical protein FDUTEX481_00368 [Tolypothrix sp. PCC 7601]MBE9087637.1 hypothetical protein [Tolypothrix sp. LEGE 11397]UYD26428.1 hypothetical protein HGR01_34965 [Tolypothrix sp. PCC 7712]UYD31334.1 hypothetical protein HG267_19520 [Tolypothrix sp. PCC 7601]
MDKEDVSDEQSNYDQRLDNCYAEKRYGANIELISVFGLFVNLAVNSPVN